MVCQLAQFTSFNLKLIKSSNNSVNCNNNNKEGKEMIKEGDYFVMVDNSGYHRVVQAGNNKIQNANKCMIDVGMVIG